MFSDFSGSLISRGTIQFLVKMSLKAFHIVFVIFSTLLALGVGAWCVWVNLVEGAPVYLAGAIASFACAIALIVYGVWFYRKMKRLRIIT